MQGLYAEMMKTLHNVEYNQSFTSVLNNGERFHWMFLGHTATVNNHCLGSKS